MRFIIFDIETNGLYHEATKIHCFSYIIYENKQTTEPFSITDEKDIVSFINNNRDALFVGHNIIRYDILVLEKLLNIDLHDLKIVDTLGLSWYLYVKQKVHGLEYWGEEFNIPKPYIGDWENLSIEDYKNRCETDVLINTKLFRVFFNILSLLYDSYDKFYPLIEYSNFKLDCLKEQENSGVTLDKEWCLDALKKVSNEVDRKTDLLSSAMPEHLGKIIKKKPNKLIKADGTLSNYGASWLENLIQRGLSLDSDIIREKPNPASNAQIKEWLFELGWIPETFKPNINNDNVPQIVLPFSKKLCPSIVKLFDKEPVLKELEDYYMLMHRANFLQSLLDCEVNGKVYASASSFTSTFRLAHKKPLTNLPKPSMPYGDEIRGCLTVPNDDYIMCGSDISSLEDSTKQHYMYMYDPKYVEELRTPGFDPHLDIAVLSNLMTKDDVKEYKRLDAIENKTDKEATEYHRLKNIRQSAKSVNFSSVYGAGPAKLADMLNISVEEASLLHDTYWERNKAVKTFANNCTIKTITVNGESQDWVLNPISNFWVYLKSKKDVFSAVNQSSGCFIFDQWLKNVRKALKPFNIPVIMQFHDELVIVCKKSLKDTITKVLQDSMKKVNNDLKLNVEITISIDFGKRYNEVH